jgi:hypothetical protein
MSRPFFIRLALVALLAMAAAACSQGPGATGGATTNPAPSGPTATAGATTPTTGGGSGRAACDILGDAEIKEILGLTVASKNPEPADTVYENVCRWTFAEFGEMDLGVIDTGAKDFFDRVADIEGGTEIAGLGDRAIKTELTGSIMALAGDTMVDLFTLSTGTSDEAEQALVQRVLDNLRR